MSYLYNSNGKKVTIKLFNNSARICKPKNVKKSKSDYNIANNFISTLHRSCCIMPLKTTQMFKNLSIRRWKNENPIIFTFLTQEKPLLLSNESNSMPKYT